MVSEHSLAIIIPAYRAQFLEAALASVLAQTDQRFQLYVFDDASPEPVAEIVQSAQQRRQLTDHRFTENLGGRSLTQHWTRCLEKTAEPWVWLFSDDDVMEPTCVAAFWQEVERTQSAFGLYRFNTRCINEASVVVAENEPYPLEEMGRAFLLVRLRGERGSTMQELIFSRSAWVAAGGFPDFPLAWAADDAFIAALGRTQPIRHVAGPRVLWRLSEGNITGKTGQAAAAVLVRKLDASRRFIAWAKQFLTDTAANQLCLSEAEINALTEAWFFRNLYFRRRWIDWRTCWLVDGFAAEVWGHPRGYGIAKCQWRNFCRVTGALGRKFARLGRRSSPINR